MRNLNDARATIGGPPLDHLPTHAELAEERALKFAAYQRKRHTLRNRLRRAWASILGEY